MARVLVVDDERDIALLLREILQFDGHLVTTAYNGAEALRELEADPEIELVLADLKMPRMSGRTLIETMRSTPSLAHTPVIIVSGAVPDTGDFPASDAYQGIIEKPFELDAISTTVMRVLTARAMACPPALENTNPADTSGPVAVPSGAGRGGDSRSATTPL